MPRATPCSPLDTEALYGERDTVIRHRRRGLGLGPAGGRRLCQAICRQCLVAPMSPTHASSRRARFYAQPDIKTRRSRRFRSAAVEVKREADGLRSPGAIFCDILRRCCARRILPQQRRNSSAYTYGAAGLRSASIARRWCSYPWTPRVFDARATATCRNGRLARRCRLSRLARRSRVLKACRHRLRHGHADPCQCVSHGGGGRTAAGASGHRHAQYARE